MVAPYVGEVLATSTPPLELLLPWKLALLAALYGSGGSSPPTGTGPGPDAAA